MMIAKFFFYITCSLLLMTYADGFEQSPKNWAFKSGKINIGPWYDLETWVALNDEWRVKIRRKKDHGDSMYLSIGSQSFYIYSNMDDDVQFNDHELDFEFIELNGDGYLDLLISGRVNYTGKVDFEIYEQEDVVFIYLCSLDAEKFELKFKKASFEVDVVGSAAEQWWRRYESADALSSDKYTEMRALDKAKSNGQEVQAQRKWHYSSEIVGISKAEARQLVKDANKPAGPGVEKRAGPH